MATNKDNVTDRIVNALRDANQRLDELESEKHAPIAVIGIGCRLPGGVDTADSLWSMLSDEVDAVDTIPSDRWDVDEWYDPDPDKAGKMYTREGGFLNDVAGFDPEFFRISPREALKLDPQQRLLLEVCWESLENAGIDPNSLRGSETGFFMGLSWHDYERNTFGMDAKAIDAYSGMGNTPSIAVGRLAFFFGCHGPTAQVDTACSASLTAIHMACQALRRGDSSLMLAGGVNLMLSPLSTVFCSKIKALAPDGRCKTFDERADGYGRGEGCGVVVLKKLEDAERDGDPILAVVRGTGINHDGPSSGLTVPSRNAQSSLIAKVLDDAGLSPNDVSYIEAHGTGTALGDPIEIGALDDALCGERSADNPLLVGSIKTNIGHLEAAAGVAGFIKTVLSLHKDMIPAHLHCLNPSSRIDWDTIPIRVPTSATNWPSQRKIAGVSSFGFSGTNAHVVLEQYRAEESDSPSQEMDSSGVVVDEDNSAVQVLCLSARNEAALRQLSQRYSDHLSRTDQSLKDVCFTANSGRANFSERLWVVGDNAEALSQSLSAYAGGDASKVAGYRQALSGERAKVAWLFTGQGSQWLGMGQELYEREPVFSQALDECDRILRDELEHSLIAVMFGQGVEAGLVDETAYTQPALFALEWALSRLWMSWGVRPSVVLGHSVGEYVAACVAGVFTLEEGLGLIAARGRLMQALERNGSMVSVMAPLAQVQQALQGYEQQVSVAAENGPASVVISGERESVSLVSGRLSESGVTVRELVVSHAFHSPLMEPMLEEFRQVAQAVTYQSPELALVSNVSGQRIVAGQIDADYWCRHVREPVHFASGISSVSQSGTTVYLELGPSPMLLSMGRGCVEDERAGWVASMRREGDACVQMRRAAGALWSHGVALDWKSVGAATHSRRVPLPTYPFQRQRYWVEPRYTSESKALTLSDATSHMPILGSRTSNMAVRKGEYLFESTIESEQQLVSEHQVGGRYVLPATYYHELALEAYVHITGTMGQLKDVVVYRPLAISDEETATLQCHVIPAGNDSYTYRIASFKPGTTGENTEWATHVEGELCVIKDLSTQISLNHTHPIDELDVDVSSLYQKFSDNGLKLGPVYQSLKSWFEVDHKVSGKIEISKEFVDAAKQCQCHPALLDGLGQAVGLSINTASSIYLPVSIESLVVHRAGITGGKYHATIRQADGGSSETRVADIDLLDDESKPLVTVRGLTLRESNLDSIAASDSDLSHTYTVTWKEAPLEKLVVEPKQGTWLVINSVSTVVVDLAARLATCCDRVSSVSISDLDQSARTISQVVEEHSHNLSGIIIDLTEHETTGASNSSDYVLSKATAFVCTQVLHTIQALASVSDVPIGRRRLVVLTRGANVLSAESTHVQISHSSVTGLLNTAAIEHDDIDWSHIDLNADSALDQIDSVFFDVWEGTPIDRITYHGSNRLVAELIREKYFQEDTPNLQLDGDATYVITGAFGGLGLEAMQWLVARGACHIVALTRRQADSGMRQFVSELAGSDAINIHVHSVDVADQTSLDYLWGTFNEKYPPIRGIVHLAGVLEDGVLSGLSNNSFDAVMHSKLDAAWNLHNLTLGMPLDFFILASSSASVLGSPGQGNYAAANSALDGLSRYRQAHGLKAVSAAFGPWDDLGMTSSMDATAVRRMTNLGWSPLSSSLVPEIFDQLAKTDRTELSFLPLNWSAFAKQYSHGQVPRIFSTLHGESYIDEGSLASDSGDSKGKAIADLSGELRHDAIKRTVDVHVRKILEFDASATIDENLGFADLGVDSLLQMELRSALVRVLSVSVSVAEFIQSRSLKELVQLIEDKYTLTDINAADDEDNDVDDGDFEELIL